MKKAPVDTGAIQNPKPLNIVKVASYFIYQNFFMRKFSEANKWFNNSANYPRPKEPGISVIRFEYHSFSSGLLGA